MRIGPLFLVLAYWGWTLVTCLPSDAKTYKAPDSMRVVQIIEQGRRHRHELQLEKERLYESIKQFKPGSDELFRLADVKLSDFDAFENLVFGMMDIYDQTVHQQLTQTSYDFRTPALKLTFDFQLAIKESHEHLRSHSFDELSELKHHVDEPRQRVDPNMNGYTPHHVHNDGDAPDSHEAIQEILQGMLQEIRQNADQLEKGMQGHHLSFSGGKIETVLKMNTDDSGGDSGGDENAVLIDQDNNEYTMTRPSDTTVIYEDMQLLHDFILIVICSYCLGWIFAALGLPAFFGYILAGIITGPAGYNLIEELIQTETLAQLGVVFIVFVLGLEFSLDKLKAMWRTVLSGATLILAVTVVFFVIMGAIVGASVKEAIFVGACVSLSSTAVVVKCIKLDHLEQLYGLLVMQDVLLGFMLAIIPALAESGVQVFIAIVKIALAFAFFGALCYTILKGIPYLPKALHAIFPQLTVHYSHELTVLGTIAICLVMLLISNQLGLGMEVGCFTAGVLLRSRRGMFESSLAAIEPVRDLFACLFFASIGLHVYPSFLASEALLLLTLAAAVIGFKYVATLGILLFLGVDLSKSSTMAAALAQISEFAFVLASRGKILNIISREVYYLLLAVTSLTIMGTPLLWKLVEKTALADVSTSQQGYSVSGGVNHHTGPSALSGVTNHHHTSHRSTSSYHNHHHQYDHGPKVVTISIDDNDKIA
ncbi:Sodium/hydrogen exchanger family-domain-containing protein [Dichotomocladium elegans]|nr:Sodium/hydrogen exchanger family-domain-containing protein [Dichotomocladium elegans]